MHYVILWWFWMTHILCSIYQQDRIWFFYGNSIWHKYGKSSCQMTTTPRSLNKYTMVHSDLEWIYLKCVLSFFYIVQFVLFVFRGSFLSWQLLMTRMFLSWSTCFIRVNPLATGNTSVCGWIFEPADKRTVHVVSRKHFFDIF